MKVINEISYMIQYSQIKIQLQLSTRLYSNIKIYMQSDAHME